MSKSTELKIPDWIMRLHNETSNEMEQLELINQHLPGWILEAMDNYSLDYSYLEKNWHKLAEVARTRPKKIIIVDRIPLNDYENDLNHLEISILCDYMTKNGYVIRRKGELIKCPVCNKALLSEKVYDSICNIDTDNIEHAIILKTQLPNSWDKKCSNCS